MNRNLATTIMSFSIILLLLMPSYSHAKAVTTTVKTVPDALRESDIIQKGNVSPVVNVGGVQESVNPQEEFFEPTFGIDITSESFNTQDDSFPSVFNVNTAQESVIPQDDVLSQVFNLDATLKSGITPESVNTQEDIVSPLLRVDAAYNSDVAQESATQEDLPSPVFNVWHYARVAGPVLRTTHAVADTQLSSSSAFGGGLTPCEIGIIACCGASDLTRRTLCFDQLGCSGSWFNDPCTFELQNEVFNSLSFGV